MTTDAGRELVGARSYHWQLCSLALGQAECDCQLPDAIERIEAEAAKAAREELLARLPEAVRAVIGDRTPGYADKLAAAIVAELTKEKT